MMLDKCKDLCILCLAGAGRTVIVSRMQLVVTGQPSCVHRSSVCKAAQISLQKSLLQNTCEGEGGLCVALQLQERDGGSSVKASCKNLDICKGSNVILYSSYKRTNFSHLL